MTLRVVKFCAVNFSGVFVGNALDCLFIEKSMIIKMLMVTSPPSSEKYR